MGSTSSAGAELALDDLCDSPPSGITRRSFLAAANALALIAVLEACTGKHHAAPANGSAKGSASASASAAVSSSSAGAATDDFLAVLRRAVQASPDFLQQTAAKAVASKDIGAITAFVRDHISVIPSWGRNDDPIWARRWGSRVTLRGGAGTLRDRADLLVDLLAAAGYTATVMAADRPSAIDLPTLYQVRAADFEPDAKLYAQAVALLPAGVVLPTPSASSAAPGDSPAQAAAKAIAAVLPTATQTATIRKDLLPASVPLVAVGTVPGGPSPSAASASTTQQYLFALGDLAPSTTAPSGLMSTNEVVPTPQLSVTVSAMTNPPPGSMTPSGQVVELVSASWPAEQVFGRQVMLNFVPPSGAVGFLTGEPTDQSVRIPMLRVQGELAAYAAPPIVASSPPPSSTSFASTPPSAMVSTGVFNGPPITLQGDILAQPKGSSANDPVVAEGAYGPLKTLSDSQRKTALSSATALHALAKVTTFPEVELDVAVLDSSGNSIDGLDAASFVVKDNGTTAPSIALMSNAVGSTKPRVLVIYDTTGSVEQTWPSAAAKTTFEQSLTTTLVDAAQQTPFDVQVAGLSDAYRLDATKWATPSQAGLVAAFAAASGDNSVVWSAASGGAIDQGVVAMIMVSDFVSSSESTTDISSAQRRIAAAHIPVICLTVAKPDATAVETMVTLSGGVELDPLAPTTSSAIAALIKPLVAARTLNTYRMRYTAPTGGSTAHTVTVTLNGRSTPVGTAKYTAPAKPATPWSFAGLYVRISVGDYDSGVRHLAGVHLSGGGSIEALDDADSAAETRAAIFGLTTIAIEPGYVTSAALIDDFIASAQSLRPVLGLPSTATAQDVVDAAGKNGVRRVPPALASLLFPPVAQRAPAAVPTMRVAILQERSDGSGGLDMRIDLPPGLNTIEPLGSDPVAAFAAALALSSETMAAEATIAQTSAFSSLSAKALSLIPAGDSGALRTFVNGLPDAQQTAWEAVLITVYESQTQLALVPTDGTTAALWVIDSKTGAATALLLDGSGGALTSTPCAPPDGWDKVLGWANGALMVFTLTCIAFNPFFCVGETTENIYIVTSILLAIASGINTGGLLGLAQAWVGFATAFLPFTGVAALRRASALGTLFSGYIGNNQNFCGP